MLLMKTMLEIWKLRIHFLKIESINTLEDILTGKKSDVLSTLIILIVMGEIIWLDVIF